MSAIGEKGTKADSATNPIQQIEKSQELKSKIKDAAHAAIDRSTNASASTIKSISRDRISDETIDSSCSTLNSAAKQMVDQAVDDPKGTAISTAKWSFWVLSKL